MKIAWPPAHIPAKFPFTVHRDGWVRRYKGRVVFVCGKGVPLREVEDNWIRRRAEIDRADHDAEKVTPESITVRVLASLFKVRQERRVETGRPEPLSPFTFLDYVRTLRIFCAAVGPDTPVADLTPEHFHRFAKRFDGKAASSMARAIAYVHAMFTWGEGAGHIGRVRYGPDFQKPSASTIRDERIGKVKRYTPDEIAALWDAADDMERLWMGLGLNGAMDNSDLSNLTWEVIDLGAGVIDYRRRKTGKVRRVIPLVPEVLRMLRAWKAHSAGEYVFSTHAGHRLVRVHGKTTIDFVSFRWTKLMQRAGLRQKPDRVTVEGGKRALKWHPSIDRRGYRGLRTTFSNLAPPGFSDERRIVMGHSHGDTFLDNYLETVGMDRLRTMVRKVWAATGLGKRGPRKRTSASAGGNAAA